MTSPQPPDQLISTPPNGAVPENPEPKTIEERVEALEQNLARMAQALAAVLAQQMQPQVQQGIFQQLLGLGQPGP